METFDVRSCQRKLAEHYQKNAKMPTTVWSSNFQVDFDEIYTRLSWVQQEQTLAGVSEKELSHYTEIFTEKKKNGVAKRILVQGETGIGKTTFVKKLLLDWSNLEEAKMDEEHKDALRKFNLVVSINLKEVSKCRTFEAVLRQSRLFPDDKTSSIDDLLSYIGENQDKVLLVFDGYDEYRTGSEAEEKKGSPIFEIFQGNVLRDCTVLVTTRSSRADELQQFADIHAGITGFNCHDREAFMLNFLGSQTEVNDLYRFLLLSNIDDLARVPLLNLFFCLLWKEEKETLEEGLKNKTELFRAILKHILQHSHKRHSPSNASQLKEADYNEILTEIGKVALEGLLRGDLLFKGGQLSEKVRGEKSVIVGLLQVSESGPSLEPKEMVSFIHKSIQEYLAAWFITYRCVPEGNLGGIEQHACTVEDCFALENVFQFLCGLSNKGAEKVFEHFLSVGTRDLSVTIPDADNKTDVPLYDLTERHWRFSDFAFNCFREVNSRTELLCRFLDGFCDVVPVPNQVLRSQFMPNVKDVSTLAPSRTFAFRIHGNDEDPLPCTLLERFSECFHIPRITESSEVLRVGDFLEEFQSVSGPEVCQTPDNCSLHFILRFRSGQLQFYITDLFLACEDHARLFTETSDEYAPSFAACLKFTRSLQLRLKVSDEAMTGLGRAIRNCRHLNSIHVAATTRYLKLPTCIDVRDGDSVCHLLEQVPNPRECSLKLGSAVHSQGAWRYVHEVRLTSAGAVKLASLLPQFNNVSVLNLSFDDAEVDALITSISHKSLKNLRLNGIILTPATATTLGRSLPHMSSLESFEVTGVKGRIVQGKEMEALFGGFYKTLPLEKLAFGSFSVTCCPSALVKSFQFFPNLKELSVGKFSMDEHNLCCLLESLSFIPNLRVLKVQGKCMNYKHSCRAQLNTVSRSFAHETLEELVLSGISLNAATAAALGRSLPEMPSLTRLDLSGMDGKMLQAEEMKMLFGGLNKTVPLLPNNLGFFSNLCDLRLGKFNMDELHLYGLIESLRFIPNLMRLHVEGKRLCPADFSSAEVNKLLNFTHGTLRYLTLKGISLTPTAAAMLGRSLPKMSLETLELTGHGSVVPAEQMERLFDGFNKTSPLHYLSFRSFNVRGCLAPLTRRLSSFPNLGSLALTNLNMDEQDLRGLLESFQFIPELHILTLSGNSLGHPVTSIVPYVINLPRLEFLWLEGSCSEEDFKSLSDALSERVTVLKPCPLITFKTYPL